MANWYIIRKYNLNYKPVVAIAEIVVAIVPTVSILATFEPSQITN